ncbi:amino acid--tRNA ligase-related protein, partial [Staphylococcus warneri]|uniref:amino acid--tRNA ligase-related protein n=1 Tax=Staphylococcus warneri TaxID=1292 RepID=UPI0034D97197
THLLHTKYFDQHPFLSQTPQLYIQPPPIPHPPLFSFPPTFTPQKSKTTPHLIQFSIIQPQIPFTQHPQTLQLQQQYLPHLLQSLLKNSHLHLKPLHPHTSKLQKLPPPFPTITYHHPLNFFKQQPFHHIHSPQHFPPPHQTPIPNHYHLPLFITNYPTKINPF